MFISDTGNRHLRVEHDRRFAYCLEQKLEDDWLLWYDVPLGPRNVHPDFVVFNPRLGLLVLEVKDWKLGTIRNIDRQKNSYLAPFAVCAAEQFRSDGRDIVRS